MKTIRQIFSVPKLKAYQWGLVAAVLIGQAIWNFYRVAPVGPAILGDEYIYSQSARHQSPWGPQITGDFSNYLFNIVYSTTNVCGPNFYTCGKILNLVFFVGFIFLIFIAALRVMPFWPSLGFIAAAGLSPLTVYTSMFLPESMYFFFLALLLLALLHAMKEQTWRNWAIVGAVIGTASLVKPHAWMAVIPIAIFIFVLMFSHKGRFFKDLVAAGGALVGAAIVARLVVGFIVAGPKTLSFFGAYLSAGTLQQVTEAPQEVAEGGTAIGTSPITGVFELFLPQLSIHVLTVSALMAIAIVGLIVAMIDLARTKEPRTVNLLALLSFIWLGAMVIIIVIFTGWLTGGGDDHTTRVLLRYYDFLFILVPLAGLAVFVSKAVNLQNVSIRWALAIAFGAVITNSFTGNFANLTIQIADAPNLAGLVVNLDTFNGVAVTMALALAVYATFPYYTKWAFVALLPFSMIAAGWQIQDQYQGFRGTLSAADRAGQYVYSNLSEEDKSSIHILANTRFDATNVAIWIDKPQLDYELGTAGAIYEASWAPKESRWIVATGDISVVGDTLETYKGEGFTLHRVR
jgi:phosphoglycerol transferase